MEVEPEGGGLRYVDDIVVWEFEGVSIFVCSK